MSVASPTHTGRLETFRCDSFTPNGGNTMPWKPQRACRVPGCGGFAEHGQYCEAHRLERMRDFNRFERDPETQAFYDSPAWKAARRKKLNEQPLCEECLRHGLIRAADLVDHITPIKCGGAKLAESNLQSLCNACHERKSIAEGSRFGGR